jgi:hypothetical protein
MFLLLMNAYVLTPATAPAVTGIPNHRRVLKLPRFPNCSEGKKSEAGKTFRQLAMTECINAYVKGKVPLWGRSALQPYRLIVL